MITFNVIKKNRKYFAATKGGCKCRILIDDNSANLELEENILEVDDISVRSKYGVDLIYKMSGTIEDQNEAGICSFSPNKYNNLMVDECRRLGGQWDINARAWIFSGLVVDEVELIDEKYNSTLTPVELKLTKSIYGDNSPVYIAGFMVARAFGRDSGAILGDGIAIISGTVDSGGSRKNWTTKITGGSVIRMMIPKMCIPDIDESIKVEVMKYEIGSEFEIVEVHKSMIAPGDSIVHYGVPKTVGKRDIKRDSFFGLMIFGDSYNLGYKLVKKMVYKRPRVNIINSLGGKTNEI